MDERELEERLVVSFVLGNKKKVCVRVVVFIYYLKSTLIMRGKISYKNGMIPRSFSKNVNIILVMDEYY